MKKGKFLIIGMLAIVLLFGLVLSGCDTKDDTTTKFEGTWQRADGFYIKFTGNNWVRTKPGDWRGEGNFTFTDTQITFYLTLSDGKPDSHTYEPQRYTLTANTLILEKGENTILDGVLVKQ
jgi:hypothetical protein